MCFPAACNAAGCGMQYVSLGLPQSLPGGILYTVVLLFRSRPAARFIA
jgi:hypothetical protein